MNTLTKIASLLMVSAGLMSAPLAFAAPQDHKPAHARHDTQPAKKAPHKKAAKPKKAAKAKKAAPKKMAKKNVKQVKHARHHAHR